MNKLSVYGCKAIGRVIKLSVGDFKLFSCYLKELRMRLSSKKSFLLKISLFLLVYCLIFTSCDILDGGSDKQPASSGSSSESSPAAASAPKSINLDEIASKPAVSLKYTTDAPGELVDSSSSGDIDYSNTGDGYIMVRYTGDSTGDPTDTRLLIECVAGEYGRYQYFLPQDGKYYPFPLTEGDGLYIVSILKRQEGSSFAQLLATEVDARIENEYLPFLISHQKIVFTQDSLSVKLAAELTKEDSGVVNKVESVYNYVIKNISYDKDKAVAAANGELETYIPDNDKTLRAKNGICFDYATLTSAMLRSLDIPTRMVFGYASVGDGAAPVYHAWISVYSSETGWIDNVIEFKSVGWTRMDPTFSSGANDKAMAAFIGDGDNYTEDLIY